STPRPLLLFFFLLVPPLPSSPLFPYTTLFRSGHRPGHRPVGMTLGHRAASRQLTRVVSAAPPALGAARDVLERRPSGGTSFEWRSEEHTSELQSRGHLVCRLLLEKKKKLIRNC